MEQQIQDLISTIRKEGLDQANQERDRIIAEAKIKADKIVLEANDKKEKIITDTLKELELKKKSMEESIRQAARDVSLSLKANIEDAFKALLNQEVTKSLNDSILEKIISSVIKSEVTSENVYLELSDKDFKALEAKLSKNFEKEIKNGLEFKVSPNFKKGFKVIERDGSAFIDLTDSEITELIFPYVSNEIKKIL